MNHLKHNENVVKQFTKQAKGYTAIKSHSDALEDLLKLSKATKKDTVLDIACGSGIVSCAFAPHVAHVTGIDITKSMIAEAKNLQQKQKLNNISWEIGEVTKLPYADEKFSIVISRFGFHHFINPKNVLEEMIRVCKPNGVVMIVDVALPVSKIKAYNEMERMRDSSHVTALSVMAFDELLEESPLKSITQNNYTMEITLHEQLEASFPDNPEKLKQLIINDIGKDKLGIQATQNGDMVSLHYPVSIYSGRK